MNSEVNEHEQRNNLRNVIPSKLLTEQVCCFPINANTFIITFVPQDTYVQREQFFVVSLWRSR